MYADDIVVFSETAEGLQNGLNRMYQLSIMWKLSVNTQKSKVMFLGRVGCLEEIHISIMENMNLK